MVIFDAKIWAITSYTVHSFMVEHLVEEHDCMRFVEEEVQDGYSWSIYRRFLWLDEAGRPRFELETSRYARELSDGQLILGYPEEPHEMRFVCPD